MAAGPLGELSRADLCTVGREYMLASHLQDRGSIPSVLRHHSMDEANQIAIEEWMTASPIYTQRMQRLLGFVGDDIATIFKGLQLDVGFPHQFMDVGYELVDATHGEFWLRSCGALADVTPMGHAFINGMCHDIEDPTFDATAAATNPYAQMRAVHRPPGVPRGGPDCHWTVTIDESRSPAQHHPRLDEMERSVVAGLPNEPAPDYSGPFDPHFELELLSHPGLLTVTREFAIQGHLLARALMTAVDRHYGAEEAIEAGRALFVGSAWIASERLARAIGVEEPDLAAIARIVALTHLLAPADYVGLRVEMPDPDTLMLTLDGDALGLTEGDVYSLPGLLNLDGDDIVAALIHGVNARAVVTRSEHNAWTVTTPDDAEPVDEPGYVRVMRFSTGPDKVLGRRIPVRSSPS